MISEILGGDMFATPFNVLVCPVNCVGVMGAGLAKQFANRYPGLLEWYGSICNVRGMKPGEIRIWFAPTGEAIFNVATKDHWKYKSTYPWVKVCLLNIAEELRGRTRLQCPPLSVALPPLGCGLGGLSWEIVRRMTYDNLSDLNHNITLFTPNANEVTHAPLAI